MVIVDETLNVSMFAGYIDMLLCMDVLVDAQHFYLFVYLSG